MKDEDDAGVLASAIAARIDLLVTNNLDDFHIKDAERIETREITFRNQPARQLYSILYERNVSGLFPPPCRRWTELQNANHPTWIGSHIWSSI